jgi:DNA invertase Pin-like site-specific DNA recombinase
MKPKAIIYCRVSSSKQKTEGSGLESQEHRCRQYAKLNDYKVVEVFRDDFSGGGDFWHRPAMRQLLAFLDENSGENYTIIFDDLKRFARDIEFHWKLRKELKQRRATPECLNFNFEETPRR